MELAIVLSAGSAPVLINRGQFEHVLINVALNARDAMPQGGRLTIMTVQVEIGAQQLGGLTFPAGRYVLLAVSDTGCGMDTETHARSFEPSGIVRQGGDNVRLQSEVGVGTTVGTYLPCVVDALATEVRNTMAAWTQRGNGTLLVVDDQREFRASIRDTLAEHGYDTIEAHAGLEALEVAARHQGAIRLLLTDQQTLDRQPERP